MVYYDAKSPNRCHGWPHGARGMLVGFSYAPRRRGRQLGDDKEKENVDVSGNRADSSKREIKRSLNGKILKNTILNILVLVIVCCVIMAAAMQSLANNILLDSMQ